MIAGAEAELGRRVTDLLTRERLLAPEAKVSTFSTPRRLAVLVEGVLPAQADTEEKLTGPSWKVAFKDDTPTPAAEAFAKKAGVAVSALEKVTTPKGEYVGATVKRQGISATEVLAGELPKEVLSIYWAKNMYWRAGKPERFVRPVRWIVALLDSSVVPLEIAGIAAGNSSRGHRVLHGDAPVAIFAGKGYAETLRGAKVVVDVAERRQSIRKALDKATRTVAGARWREDEPLVDTVLHLTEWPSVILGNFERSILRFPRKFWSPSCATIRSISQSKMPTASSLRISSPCSTPRSTKRRRRHHPPRQRARARRSLQRRAIFLGLRPENSTRRPRRKPEERNLPEAARQLPLEDRREPRHRKETRRLHENSRCHSLTSRAASAVELAKTDLTASSSRSSPNSRASSVACTPVRQGLGEEVATAIYEQYRPASTEDNIPVAMVEGQLLGIADRIQTITAMFGIGMAPTGSKDPFALRRAANAIVKILAESGLTLTLSAVMDAAQTGTANRDQVAAFFRERLNFYLKDVRGFSYDVVNAVLAAGADDVRDAIARAEALSKARTSEDFAAISAAFKRIKNILRQAEEKKYEIGTLTAVKLASEAQNLASSAATLAPQVALLRSQRDYGEALGLIATLRPAVDTFFDKVMVLDPDPVGSRGTLRRSSMRFCAASLGSPISARSSPASRIAPERRSV